MTAADSGERVFEERVAAQGRAVRFLVVPASGGGGTEGASAPPAVGLPVVLLHGLAGSGNVWIRTLRRIVRTGGFSCVIAPDMPGYGDSMGPGRALDIDELADWLADFLDAVNIEKAHIAGNSMGCQVALYFAKRYPDRAGALTLTGPTVGSKVVPLWRYLIGIALNSFNEPFAYKRLAARMFFQMGLRRYWVTVREMMNEDVLGMADAVRSPCLILRGTRDYIIPEASAIRLAAALPNGAYRTVANAAHVLPFNSPAEFVDALAEFCAATEENLARAVK